MGQQTSEKGEQLLCLLLLVITSASGGLYLIPYTLEVLLFIIAIHHAAVGNLLFMCNLYSVQKIIICIPYSRDFSVLHADF